MNKISAYLRDTLIMLGLLAAGQSSAGDVPRSAYPADHHLRFRNHPFGKHRADRLLSAPSVALIQVKKEIDYMVSLVEGNVSPYYSSVVTGLERVADHLVNVGYSIDNPTGEMEEDN